MLHSVKDIGTNMCRLTTELEGCWVTDRDGTDLARLKAMTQSLFNPWEFSFMHEPDDLTGDMVTHLVINGQDVFDELTDSKVHYENHNYYEFGYSLGYSLDQITMKMRMDDTLPVGWLDNSMQCPAEHKQSFELMTPHGAHRLFH